MKRIANGRGRAAFTLLEILVAVAILGIVSTTVAFVMGVGVEAWRAGTEMAEESHDGEGVMEQVVMALRSAYYPANGEPDWDFGFQHEDGGDGESARDSISWVKIGNSLVGEDTPWAGAAHRVRLYVEDSNAGDGPGLYVAAWQTVGQAEDFDPDEDVEPLLLSDRVVGLDCRMQDPQKAIEPDEPFEWIDEWTASNRIPDHVLVTLALRPQKKGADPDVLVRCVQLPMSAVSWNPTKPGGGGRGGRDRNNRGGRNAATRETGRGRGG
ncbi:MAG: prepilin-type N-terminal cleavage/methylation domain-containing protein, partial [Kiritimatiellae bacterium]|nr:prepilin-type N-terminal cleavage/methylation domain-containing protein [Kiritimatiellia bacterium]